MNNLTNGTDRDQEDLLHERTGCTATAKLIEAYRQVLVTNTGLQRHHLTKRAGRRKQSTCGICARTKITRKQFPRKEHIVHTRFLEKVTCDISVYLNCPSREGWKYILVFIDEATKMFWTYGLFERTSDAVLQCLHHMHDHELPEGAVVEHLHSDGGKELICERVKMYMRLKGTRKFTNTPTDTPELNSVSERKFRNLGEVALALLSRSGLPKIWWGKAYKAAEYIIRRMPTKTAQGYMTPLEAIPGGQAPSWEWLRVWGCKAYVLKPKADRRKDWDDKAQIGYFTGYSETTVGWEVYLPASNTFVTSVHVLFDESPPERSDEYFRELDEAAAVFTGPESESLSDYTYLIGTHHIDDEDQLLYITTNVTVRKGLIVAYRAQVTGSRQQRPEKDSIHVKDVVKMTNLTNKRHTLTRLGENPDPLLTQSHAKSSRVEETDLSEEMSVESIRSELIARGGARSAALSAKSRGSSGPSGPEAEDPRNSTQPFRGRSMAMPTHGAARSTVSNSEQSVRTDPMMTSNVSDSEHSPRVDSVMTSTESDSEHPARGDSTMRVWEKSYITARESAAGTHASMSTAGKRVRVQRVPMNIGREGGANLLEVPFERHAMLSELCRTIFDEDDPYRDPGSGTAAGHKIVEPTSNKIAMETPEWRRWNQAKEEENEALRSKNAMRLVKIEPGMHIIKSKYVFKLKKKYGKIVRFKARLVALGYDQDVDPLLNFAPVVKPNTVRLLMALAQTNNMRIHQIDIANAFCCADIEGDVFISAPDGLEVPEGMCFKLEKSLYGLRTSPRSWNKEIDKTLKSLHFKPTVADPCLYSRWSGGKQYLVLVYVDDILIAGERVEHINEIEKGICDKYAMTDMGELDNFLNADFTQTTEKITIDQTHYCREVLDTFKFLVRGKTSKTPLPTDALEQLAAGLDVTEDKDEDVRSYPYRQVVGALLYLAMYTKPEISYAVGVLSRFNDKKTAASCKLATYLLRYLNANQECRIEFSGKTLDLHGFSDADWGSDIITRRSTTGYIIFAAGGPISWQSKLQTTVAVSSMESEYMALFAGIQELVWIRGVLKELERPLGEPTPFLVDSKSAQDLAGNPVYHKRSKHIDIKYHWLRDHTSEYFGTATLHHCATLDMSADIFTKALASSLFFQHAETITGKRPRCSSDYTNRKKHAAWK